MRIIARLLAVAFCFLLGLSCFCSLATQYKELTIREAIEIARENDGKHYIVRGTVKMVEDGALGRFYIQDEAGYTLYIHGIDSLQTDLVPGDQVELLGLLTTYNGEARMMDAQLRNYTPAEKEEPTPPILAPETVTLAQACAIAAGQQNAFTSQQYIVTGPVYKVSAKGHVYLVDDEGNVLPIGSIENASQLAPGDILTVQGVLGKEGGQAQMKDVSVLEHIRSGPTYTGDPAHGYLCALLLSAAALLLMEKKCYK